MKPHTPLFAPPEWADRYPVDSIELPETGPVESYPDYLKKRIANFETMQPRLRKAHMAGYLGNL